MMLRKIVEHWRARRARRCSMRHLFLGKDDRMLRDIGLTRDELHELLQDWPDHRDG